MAPVRLWRSFYSNLSRGKRQKENQDNLIPYILEPRGSSKEYRKNWADKNPQSEIENRKSYRPAHVSQVPWKNEDFILY